VTFLGWLRDPFKGLSDLQLGDEKVTLNHLVRIFVRHHSIFKALEKHTFWFGGKICVDNKNSPCFFGGSFQGGQIMPNKFLYPNLEANDDEDGEES